MSDVKLVTVTETGDGRYTQQITAGPHNLTADEPTDLGGNDSGPDPYGLLLSALGACTSMTVRMYAERRGLPLEKVMVSLTHERIHAEDCENCETKVGRIDRIERTVTLEGDLDDGQRAKLLEIANKCPVHRTLQSEVLIDTSLT